MVRVEESIYINYIKVQKMELENKQLIMRVAIIVMC